ncbi:TRAP transporter large permease subunit [Arthrobacter sp. NPDC056727]|uniref:TRAP transporter large permease subunit n=1 Tax=Arthrobacter sp. NPDC056727 TaxID=3345927 RepID=UPI003670A881
MTAIFALGAFIAAIVLWNVVFKRNIAEAMFVGFVAAAGFAGADFFPVLWKGFLSGIQNEVVFAALAFVIVGEILTKAGIIQRIVDILSSMLGRLRGGSIYAATVGSGVFGAVAHNGAATAATVGAITIPWIKRSNASGETAAVVLGGNSGVGAVFPFSGAFFLLLAAPTVTGVVSAQTMALTAFIAALWMVVVRLVSAFFLIRKQKVGAMDPEDVKPLRVTFLLGWTSLLVLAAVALPILATSGTFVTDRVGEDAFDAVPVLVWLPVAMLLPGLIVGRKQLPRTGRAWWDMFGKISPKLGIVAVTMISAFSASDVISKLGLSKQMTPLLAMLNGVPAIVVAIIVGIIIIIVAGPLSTTATLAAVGSVAFAALTAAGIPAPLAFAALLIWAASESASPPGAAPLYVAAGIAGVDPVKTFFPVIMYYLIPTFLLGVLIAVGVLWIP